VAKEDKHTNLIRGRAMKAKALAQTLLVSSTPTKVCFFGVVMFNLADATQASSGAAEVLTVDRTCSRSTPISTNEGVRTTKRTDKIRGRKSAVLRRSTASIKPVKKSRGPVCAMPDSLPGTVLSESGGELSISGTDNDWDGTSISPQFTLACDSSDESIVTPAASDFMPSPNDFLAGFFGGPDQFPQIFSELDTLSVNDKPISMDQDRLLTKGERVELYDLISGSISSSSVSVGASQSSDILPSVDDTNRGGRLYHHENAGKPHLARSTCVNAFEPTHFDSHDLKTWLLDDLDLRQSAMDTHFLPHFLPSLRGSLNGHAGFYEPPVANRGYGMISDPQPTVLSSRDRLPASKVPISVAFVKQVCHPTLLFPDPLETTFLCKAHCESCQRECASWHILQLSMIDIYGYMYVWFSKAGRIFGTDVSSRFLRPSSIRIFILSLDTPAIPPHDFPQFVYLS
jgi:hypothetical protein